MCAAGRWAGERLFGVGTAGCNNWVLARPTGLASVFHCWGGFETPPWSDARLVSEDP